MRLIILLTIILLTPSSTDAQVGFDVGGTLAREEKAVSITTKPAAPNPNTEFNAALSLTEFGSEITWLLDGEEVANSRNKNNIDFVSVPAGETMTITAQVTSPAGNTQTISKDVSPLYLDIILEPQTYNPDFYLGRSLPSFGSQLNATAILSGTDILDTDLVYRWQAGNEVVGQGALRGQYKVSFLVPKGSFPTLSLSINTPEGDLLASRFITMPSVYPDLVFYEKSTLFGLNQRPIDQTLNLVSDSTLVEAVPYNLDSRVYNSPDLVEWEIGQRTFDNLSGNPYEVTLQRNSGAGTAKLNFHVRSMENLLQGAEDSINIRP
jgi:hypothetical protein